MKHTALIVHARSWLGVPFLHQGRTRFGVDCVGYPIALFKELGMVPVTFNDIAAYGRSPCDGPHELFYQLAQKHCRKVPAPIPGAMLLLQWPKMPAPTHVAFFTGKTILHTHQQAGRVVEHSYREPWLTYTHSAWLLPGVTYE